MNNNLWFLELSEHSVHRMFCATCCQKSSERLCRFSPDFNSQVRQRHFRVLVRSKISNQGVNFLVHKVGCIFPMVISSDFRMGEHRDDDHQEDAPHFRTVTPRAYRGLHTRMQHLFSDSGQVLVRTPYKL